MSVRRRLSCALVLAACLACGAGASREPRAARVILITCDTLRADRLGVYGYERGTSPCLDAFAREGVVFEEAYSCAPWTQPAVSSLLTGRPPEEIGAVPGNVKRIPSQVETLAERLSRRGVATAAVVSNVLLIRVPERFGDLGVQQGFQHYDDRMESREKNRGIRERLAPDTTAAASAWLETRAGRPGEPFFLWVHYQDPHGPYTPPPEVAADFERPPPAAEGEEPPLPLGRTMRGLGQVPFYQILDGERRPGVYRDRYDAEIRHFDRHLGRLLARLRELDLYDDALIVFSADHGESLGEHGYFFCHGENLHREAVRVPLIVRFPRGADAGVGPGADGVRRCAAVAGHLDVWPTVLRALGLDAGDVRGLDLAQPALLPAERVLVQGFAPLQQPPWWAASDGRYRLVWSEAETAPRLFDVRADPFEQRDLAAQEPERVQRMLAAHRAWMERSLRSVHEGEVPGTDSLEALRALGYAEPGEGAGGR